MADDFDAIVDSVDTDVAGKPEAIVDAVVDAGEERVADADVAKPITGEIAEPEGDGRKLPQWIRNLKEVNGELYKQAKADFFREDRISKEFPGGIGEAKAVKDFVAQHGGVEGAVQAFADLTAKSQELEGVMERIVQADASVLKDLPPDSVAKLSPAILSEWSTVAPEAYAHHMTGIMAGVLTSTNEAGQSVTSVIKDLEYALRYGATDEMKTAVAQLSAWANGMVADARKAPPAMTQGKKPTELDSREQALNQREEAAYNSTVMQAVEGFRTPAIENELKAYIAKAPTDEIKKDIAIREVKRQVVERLSQDKDYQEKMKAFAKRRDTEGRMKLLKSRESVAIAEIAPKVGRGIYGSVEAPKPAQPAVTGTKPAIPRTPNASAQNKRPSFEEIFMS